MKDISAFARQAAEVFNRSQEICRSTSGGRHYLDLPAAAVEDLVRAIFYASLIPDESRYPVVTLLSYRADTTRFWGIQDKPTSSIHLPFCPPLEPSQQNIAKLAHGVGPNSHLCILCDEGMPTLGGINITVLEEVRHFGYSAFRVGNPLKLRIRGPGHIEASNGGIALVYKAGDISEERLLLHSDVMEALKIRISLGIGFIPDIAEGLDALFNDIAEAIVKQGHGGMLIITETFDPSQFSSHRSTDAHLLRRRLTRYYECVSAANWAAGGSANLLAGTNSEKACPYLLAVASETSVLENCVDLIAHLAGMDGAIVMDYAAHIIAFNAITSKSLATEGQFRLVDEIGRTIPDEVVVKDRGSRHQSALHYAKSVPGCFVFAISQDGGVTAFHNCGDGTVRCEQHLRVLD